MVLNARDLVKSFATVKAVQGVSLNVEAGQCVALLGPNGAGKTTTIEMLEGLSQPDQGELRLFGLNYAQNRREILSRIGVLLQETYLYKRYSVRETWQLFGSFYPQALSPEDLAVQLQLQDKLDVHLRHLSGGQKQRVYLGCALLNQPEILFLDEPTTGLDPLARRQIWDLVSQWKRRGVSILLTTHYMEEAEVLADQVVIMDNGKIVTQGAPAHLVADYCGAVVFELRGDMGRLGDAVRSATQPLSPRFMRQNDDHWEIAFAEMSAASEVMKVLTEEAAFQGVDAMAIQMRRASLEDVFIQVSGRGLRDV